MSGNKNINTPLLPDHCYYIYSHGNNHQKIFFQQENYRYFLFKYHTYLSSVVDTLSWALLPNAFHLLIKIKSKEQILSAAEALFKKVDKAFLKKHVFQDRLDKGIPVDQVSDLTSFKNLLNLARLIDLRSESQVELITDKLSTELAIWVVSQQLRRFMLSYAKSINKQQKRTGSLFQKPFRREIISGEIALKNQIGFIHHLPIHSGLSQTFSDFTSSSFNQHLFQFSNDTIDDIIKDLFINREAYEKYHAAYKLRAAAL